MQQVLGERLSKERKLLNHISTVFTLFTLFNATTSALDGSVCGLASRFFKTVFSEQEKSAERGNYNNNIRKHKRAELFCFQSHCYSIFCVRCKSEKCWRSSCCYFFYHFDFFLPFLCASEEEKRSIEQSISWFWGSLWDRVTVLLIFDSHKRRKRKEAAVEKFRWKPKVEVQKRFGLTRGGSEKNNWKEAPSKDKRKHSD